VGRWDEYPVKAGRVNRHIASYTARIRGLEVLGWCLALHLLISLPSEGQSLWANQISSTYLNWWLRYNYYRFWKTNVRHIGNLLSVSIATICPKSAHYSASDYRILSKLKHPLRKYDAISISQDGGRDGWILLPVSYLLMPLPSEGQSLLANQILSRYLKWRLRYIFMAIQNGWVKFCFKIKNVSICWNALLHFMNTKMYFWSWITCRLSLHNSTPSHCTAYSWTKAWQQKKTLFVWLEALILRD